MKKLLLCTLLALTTVASPITYNELLDSATAEVGQLEKNLSKAEKAAKKTKSLLTNTVVELAQTEVKIDMLQQQIDTVVTELNKQITLAQEYKEKYNKAQEKLAWWHKIAAYITIGIVCYVAFIALKAAGKI